jgi:hypothetical protein
MSVRVLVVALGVVLAAAVVVQILNANVFSDLSDTHAYGRFTIPGSKVLKLPGDSLELVVSNPLGGVLDVPPASTAVVAPLEAAGPAPVVHRDVGDDFGTSSRYGPDIQYRREWTVDVPSAGFYRVSVGGVPEDSGLALNVGHGPPLGAFTIWAAAGLVALSVVALWVGWGMVRRAREPA